jgi:hypothetical protein
MDRFVFTLVLVFAALYTVTAQKQLVLLQREKVLLRLTPGDEFVFSLKGDKRVHKSYVNNLFDTAVMAHKTAVPFHKINRIYFDRRGFINVIGGMLVTAGAAYFLIDQFNGIVVQGEGIDLADEVLVPSAIMIGVGVPLMKLNRRSVRLGGKYRLLTIEKGSPFYNHRVLSGLPVQED